MAADERPVLRLEKRNGIWQKSRFGSEWSTPYRGGKRNFLKYFSIPNYINKIVCYCWIRLQRGDKAFQVVFSIEKRGLKHVFRNKRCGICPASSLTDKEIFMPTVSILRSRMIKHFICPETKAKRSSCNVLTPSVTRCPSFWKWSLKVGQKTGERRAYCYEQIWDWLHTRTHQTNPE